MMSLYSTSKKGNTKVLKVNIDHPEKAIDKSKIKFLTNQMEMPNKLILIDDEIENKIKIIY